MGGRSKNSKAKYRKTKPQRILIRCGFLVGAGGLREPHRKRTRVAAPSGCIVPWAARASCWPQPQQLLPVSATGSGRRCCTGAFLPAGLFGGSYELRLPLFPQPLGRALKKRSAAPASPPCFRRRRRSAPLLFESTLASPFARQIKQKLRYPLDTGVLGGRGWIARAALLKTAHWAVFALSSATAPQLFESTLAAPFSRQVKQKLRYPLDTGVLGGAKQPKSEPLPSGASLAAISSKAMVFVPSL